MAKVKFWRKIRRAGSVSNWALGRDYFNLGCGIAIYGPIFLGPPCLADSWLGNVMKTKFYLPYY